MALICNRHSYEYAENVCSKCGIAFCHDCLVYPRGPKKPPLCVPCAITAAGVRSSARNHSNLSRREVKKRVREAKGMQQPRPYVEAPASPSADRDFELTSNATFDQGWAVSWDEGRDPHPGYPEPTHVTWGDDPFASRGEDHHQAPVAPAPTPAEAPSSAPATSEIAIPPEPSQPPARPPDLPRLQPVELGRGHAPARPGGLPSVRPPLKQPASPGSAQLPAQQPRVFGGAPATRPAAPAAPAAASPAPAPSSGRLRRKDKEPEPAEGAAMLGWLDEILGTDKGPAGH